MLRLKRQQMQSPSHAQIIKPKQELGNATKLALRAGKGGIVPPIEHRFKPGAEWKGNAGGRPKRLTEAYHKALAEPREIVENIVENGQIKQVTRIGTAAEAIGKTLVENAEKSWRFGVGAAQELRKVVEPTEEEAKGSTDKLFIRTIIEAIIEKKANAIDI